MAKLTLRVCLWIAAVGAAAVAVWVGGRTVWAGVLRRPEFRVNALALNLNRSPEWVNRSPMAAQLRKELSALPAGTPLFRKDLAHAVQREVRSSPWVLDVTEVQRRLPNKLVVKAVFRKPAGVVLFDAQHYLVDEEGHWLPDELFSRPPEWAGERTPLMVHRALRRAPPRGGGWDGPALAVGAQLTEFLRRNGLLQTLHLTTIDVTGVGLSAMEPDIVLTAASGAEVRWGKSSVYEHVPGLTAPASLTPDTEKLEMLMSKLNDYPALEGIKYVDLRFHGKIVLSETD